MNAGEDQQFQLPQNTLSLTGVVSDDGLPNAQVSTTWSVISGPGEVSIAQPDSLTTAVTFTLSGTYVLGLMASDGDLTSTDQLTVTVLPEVIDTESFTLAILPDTQKYSYLYPSIFSAQTNWIKTTKSPITLPMFSMKATLWIIPRIILSGSTPTTP